MPNFHLHLLPVIAIVILLFGVLIGLYFWLFRRRSPGRKNAQLRKMARSLNIPLHEGSPLFPRIKCLKFLKRPLELEGNYQGKAVKIYHHYQNAINNRATAYAAINILGSNPFNLTFSIRRKMLLHNVFPRKKSFQFQDPTFDSLFTVKTNDPTFTQTFLTHAIRSQLCEAVTKNKACGTLSLKGNILKYEEPSMINNDATEKRFKGLLNLMCCLRENMNVYLKGK